MPIDAAGPRFHWSLSSVGEAKRRTQAHEAMSGAPDLGTHLAFCREAEKCGVESLLMAFGFTRPDPFCWSAALGTQTEHISFLIAIRSGISSPTYFVQQINTLSVITSGRVFVNIVAGRAPGEHRYYGDFLPHDQRYDRTDEFWQICHALWRNDKPVDFEGTHYRVEGARINTPFASELGRPQIFLGGSSQQASDLAIRHADCLLTFPDTPERLAKRIGPILASGTQVGLMVSLIAGPTRNDALEQARALVESAGEQARNVHDQVRDRLDSVGFAAVYDMADSDAWPAPFLWTGAVPYLGPPAIALVGSADEIVSAIGEYVKIGVTQFLFTGHPDLEQMRFFGTEILPRVREQHAARRT